MTLRDLTVRHALALGALLFTTAAAPASAATGDIVLYARRAPVVRGAWSVVTETTAASGARMANPDAGAAKMETALASPANYFELTFTPEAGRPYHLWIRGKALNDSWLNDSAFVQFSGSLTASGNATYRIGTTSAAIYSLEEASGMGESGWGWQDNGYGLNVLGAPIYFSAGTQTIRVQSREDGLSIDQIVLSPDTYKTAAPGRGKDDTTVLPETTTTTPTPTVPVTTTSTTSLTWTSLVNASAVAGTIQKVAGCGSCADAGGVSQPATSVSFVVPTAAALVAGLGRNTSTDTSSQIDYGFNFTGTGAWEIRENGTYRKDGTLASSDVFTVAVEGTAVKYYRNGSLLYTSGTAVTSTLVADTSLRSDGATVQVVAATVSGAATPAAPAPAPTPAPAPAPTTTGAILRVLQWNTHHGGYGTDGSYDTNRLASWIVKMNPDVVMLNEIEKFTSWGNQDQPEVYKSLLQQKTGKTWYSVFAQEFGAWTSNGKGNLILSTFPIQSSDRYELLHNYDRSLAEADITVNGRNVTLILTHLDPYDQSLRLAQATEVTTWASPQPQNRIITGDMNAWPDQTSIAQYRTSYYDSWAVAAANGTATAFSGNNGETKSGRIDYIFYSTTSANLTVKASQVFDTRDANGVMPSDHRPVLTTFEVK